MLNVKCYLVFSLLTSLFPHIKLLFIIIFNRSYVSRHSGERQRLQNRILDAFSRAKGSLARMTV